MWNIILLIGCGLFAFFGGPTMDRALGSYPNCGLFAAIVLAVVVYFVLRSK